MDQRPSRSSRALAVADTIGELLLLQLLFLLFTLPLLTMLPAAVALQRSLRDVFIEGRPRAASLFIAHFLAAIKQCWQVALLVPLFIAAAAGALVFWFGVGGMGGNIAVLVLVPIVGAAAGLYIAVLAGSMTGTLPWNGQDGWREWLAAAKNLAAPRALVLAGSIVVLATWLLLAARVPTLIPIGSGLVPAAMAWWTALPWIRERRAALASD